MELGKREEWQCGDYKDEWDVLDEGADRCTEVVALVATVDGLVASCGYGLVLLGVAQKRQ